MSRRVAASAIAAAALASAGAPANSLAAARHPAAPRAPSGPPLVSGASAYGAPRQEAETEPESAASGEDPLVRNGLRSPLCGLSAGQLSPAAVEDCRTSGFLAASAPSEDYAFDTHIDTAFGLGVGVAPLLQDYIVRPVWMAIVWLVHALLVGLEWAYALDLLRGPLASGLGGALRSAEAELTRPWLAAMLALAAVLAAYQGLVRRRVAESVGEAMAALGMIAAAMFVIADPNGTVGALSRLADEASIGAFGAIEVGSSARPYATLATSMHELYAVTIEAPWCFLEFGDVSWCDQPSRLDRRLRKAALRIAGQIEAEGRGPGGEAAAEALLHRAQLLRQADTNGEIFLALPANGVLRNSVKEPSSLFSVLCGGGEDATHCRGPTAAQAEFRTSSGTLSRIGGVFVIAIGALGMLLLIGFVVVRLLEAAIVSLLFLLLTPAAALAPACGEPGRRAFRGWASRMLGAVTAKLLWSLLLGALLATMRVLLELQDLGWLAQWLLMGALWWGALLRRHHLLPAALGREALAAGARRSRPVRQGEEALDRMRRRAGGAVRDRFRRKPPRQRRSDEDEGDSGRSAERGGRRAEGRSGGGEGRSGRGEGRSGRGEGRSGRGEGRNGRLGVRDGSSEIVNRPAEEATERPHCDIAAGQSSGGVAAGRPGDAAATRRLDADGPGRTAEAARQRADASGVAGERRRPRRVAGENQAQAAPSARSARAHAGAFRDGRIAEAERRRREPDASSPRDGLDRELAMRSEARRLVARDDTPPSDPVMRDAFEVARRRKRQLGWGSREEG